jgi:hypothetical protein
LKPANVMITAEGRVKILDFGLAKQTVAGSAGDETFAQHTVPGMIVGTVSYMSPEQARGRVVDYRSDQFSFGLMLYEMATGRKAFDEPESVQTLSAIIANEPPPLEARSPAPLRWVIDRCLAKNPEHRYESSRDLFHELRSLREHLSEISTQVGHQAVEAPAAKRARMWHVPAAFLLGLIVPVALALARMGPAQPAPSDYRFTPFSFEPGGQSTPVFATDDKAIAYAARQTLAEPYQVYVRYLDAPTGMQLTQVSTAHAYPIAWSPDSKRVLFVQAAEAPGIYSIPTAGGEPQLLIPPARTPSAAPSSYSRRSSRNTCRSRREGRWPRTTGMRRRRAA